MPHKLSKPKIHELSLVFAQKDGSEWAPRNDEARVLGFKGSPTEKLQGVFDTLKSYFQSNDDLVRAYPVTEAVDDIDNDGDGPEDYNEIASALCQVAYDINQAYGISDDSARSLAIVAAIKSFLLGLDALRAGDEDKAAIVQPSDAPVLTPEEANPVDPITKGDSLAVSEEEVDMTPDEIQAIVKAAAAEAVAANEAANAEKAAKAAAEAKAALDAANAEAEKANADKAKAEAEAAEAKAAAEKAQAAKDAAEAAGVEAARKGNAQAQVETNQDGLTRLQRTVKAQMKLNPFSTAF